jgi:phospholipase C
MTYAIDPTIQAPTELSLPAIRYPRGFKVEVTPSGVVSVQVHKNGAHLMATVHARFAQQVTVTVRHNIIAAASRLNTDEVAPGAATLGPHIRHKTDDGVAAAPRRGRWPFSPAEFERLRTTLHALPAAEAERRFNNVEPLSSPPPRQAKVDHVVVLLMENRAFDHILGCMLGDKPGIDGIPASGHQIPADFTNTSAGVLNISCGTAEYVCAGYGGYELFDSKMCPGANRSKYPYGNQSDACSELHGAKKGKEGLTMFNRSQLPVKAAITDEFGVFNKYWTSVPSASTPNHLFAQSATSCGVRDNIMYSQCGGPTDTFPQLTIYDSLYLNGINFSMYINSTCGLDGKPCGDHCNGPGGIPGPGEPSCGEEGSAVNLPDVSHVSALSAISFHGVSLTLSAVGLQVAMRGVGRHKDRFFSQTQFYWDAANGSLPSFSWLFPPPGASDHPCHSLINGERVLKDVYEALRAGPKWNKTLLLVAYDDAGTFYDHLVPPSEGVPNDEAPCNANITSNANVTKEGAVTNCTGFTPSGGLPVGAFDFQRLGLRAAAMLISPLVAKGAVFQEPSCSASERVSGQCPAATSAAGPTSQPQFEHSSIP